MTEAGVGKVIKIREQQIWPPLALAPMVGLSHTALRTLVHEIGGAGLYFTEMLSAKRLPEENEKVSPYLARSAGEFPLFYQIFLSDDHYIEPVCERLHELDAQGVDINLGCPAPKIRKQGAGFFLTQRPEVLKRVLRSFRRNTALPLTVKIRLGETLDEEKLIRFCHVIEDAGVDMITVHGRLHGEKFCRKPRWAWIGKVKQRISIPIFANGGIFTVEDARNCLSLSGADGLMLGRGAALRPWLFSDIAREVYGCSLEEKGFCRKQMYMRFMELLTQRLRPERCLGRLKQFTHYFAGTFTYGHQLATTIQTASSMEQAEARAISFFNSTHI